METFLTILSYLFAGGVSSVITAFITVKAIQRKAIAEAKNQEEEAERKSIENTERWRVSYGNIIADLTERLEQMLKKNNEIEQKYHEIEIKYRLLERKYEEMERQYNKLKNQQ